MALLNLPGPIKLEPVLAEREKPCYVAPQPLTKFPYWKINSHLASETKVRVNFDGGRKRN